MKNTFITLIFTVFATCFVQGQLTLRPLGSTASADGYIEYLPEAYTTNPEKKLPIILFFHGSGENGNGTTDLHKIYNTGLPNMIRNNTWSYKNQFVVLMPQHTSTTQYNICPSANDVKNFIEYARKAYNVDSLQLYITGLSCGGNGVWDFIGAYPSNDKVAAAVPISANGTKASREGKAGCLKAIPTWAFHGQSDNTSPWKNDVTANDFFNACPEPHAEAKLTLYPGVGHDAWTQTYNLSAGNDIYAWMLQQKSPSLVPNGTKNIEAVDKQIHIFPNPFANELNIKIGSANNENIHLTITDLLGRNLFTSQAFNTNESIVLHEQLPDGLLIVQAQYGNDRQTCKVFKSPTSKN